MFKFTGCLWCVHPYQLWRCWDNMQSFVASYTEFVLCFGAASSDFGLNLHIYVSSSGQILKWLHVFERERERECHLAESFFFVLNRVFGTMFVFFSCLLLWCSEKMHWSIRLRVQTGGDSARWPDFSESCVFYKAFFLSLIFFLYFCFTSHISFFDFLKTIVKFPENLWTTWIAPIKQNWSDVYSCL